jgi:hypothetical protein
MKTKQTMKTTLCMIWLATGCALAQEAACNNTNLTVTDPQGRVLMTNATYTCAYMGRLFFGRGCSVEGFAADTINPGLLRRLGIDLKDVETKAREDVRKKEESNRAYQRCVQNQIARKALEDERAAQQAEAEAARRAEEEKSARELARKEMLRLEGLKLAGAVSPAVQSGGQAEIWQSSIAVPYPVFTPQGHAISWSRAHRPELFHGQTSFNAKFVPLNSGRTPYSHDSRARMHRNQAPPQAPRVNPPVKANCNHWAPVVRR